MHDHKQYELTYLLKSVSRAVRASSSHRERSGRSSWSRRPTAVRSSGYAAYSWATRSMNSGRVNPFRYQLSASTYSGDGRGSVRLVITKPDLRSSSVYRDSYGRWHEDRRAEGRPGMPARRQ